MKNLYQSLICLLIITYALPKLEEEIYDVVLDVSYYNYAGPKCTFALETNASKSEDIFDPDDIEKQIFITKIIDNDNNAFNINCSFWKSDCGSEMTNYKSLVAICNLIDNKTFSSDRFTQFKLEEYIMNYKGKKIKIFSSNFLKIKYIDKEIPFIYSNTQYINLNDEKDIYELKFKVGSVYNKNLFLDYLISLDNCEVNQNEMTCYITKIKLESFVSFEDRKEKNYTIYFYSFEEGEMHYSQYRTYVSPVTIQYHNKKQKKDIFVEILNLLSNFPYTVFKTNVTDISNIDTGIFELYFYEIEYGYNQKGYCHFKKVDNFPLLLICRRDNREYDVSLLNMTELNLSEYDININYNFILNYNKGEKIEWGYCSGCNKIYTKYPEILDYTVNDDINLTMYSYQCEKGGITLNQDSPDLVCETSPNEVIRCIVPKSHFKGKKSGYYFIYHNGCIKGKDIAYETSPLKVILPEEEDDEKKEDSSKMNKLLFIESIILILFLI